MKVVALKRGYYGSRIQDEGDEFILTDKTHFSKTWMEKVAEPKGRAKAEPKGDDA